ncbi:MAG: serine/threonine protein kinase [Verrucomicrobiales bacterium]|nr:serine/threonine protein kinase [Verrucomicrobiales bacterium]
MPESLIADVARQFPQFEILECLGRGGMAVVYKARQPRLDRLVALKVLAPHRAKDPQFAERFQREAQALARLNHPAIVAVYEFGEANGLYYLVMEYVDGATLRDVLRQGRVPPALALNLVPKICEALQFAHHEGVVHRDIKPENILLDRQGRVKIADFGIAKLFGAPSAALPLTEAKSVVGTPHYMAPEQVEHPQGVDHRADLYSLGVVFYELLTGELPLGRFPPPSSRSGIDPRLDAIVLRALEKEPTRRYQQASDIRTEVESLASPASPPSATSEDPIAYHSLNRPPIPPDAPSALRWLAAGLTTVGAANLLGTVLILLGVIGVALCDRWGVDLDGPLPELADMLQSPDWSVARGLAGAVMAVLLAGSGLILLGALRLRRLASYRLALMACVLSLVLLPASWLGIPVGIWGLVLLGRRSTQQLFQQAHQRSAPSPESGASQSRTAWWIVAGSTALISVVLFWLGSGEGSSHRKIAAELTDKLRAEQDNHRAMIAQQRAVAANGLTAAQPPPVIIQTVPVSGDAQVPSNLGEIRITFSQPMLDRLRVPPPGSSETRPEFTGDLRWSDDHRTLVAPVQLRAGRTYAWWLNPGHDRSFESTDGQAAIPYLLIFQTAN